MKIAILTQHAIDTNYGCIMQAYALQHFLRSLGHDAKTVNFDATILNIKFYLLVLYGFLRKILFNRKIGLPLTNTRYQIATRETSQFLKRNFRYCEETYNMKLMSHEALLDYDAFIVGSDQVWRSYGRLSNYVKNCMFEFAKDRNNVKRIAYAASFGTDKFICSKYELNICKNLLDKFDAISVREDSGVNLCKELFDIDAKLVIDPTMLFDANRYIELSRKRNDYINNGDLFVYILDENVKKNKIIQQVEKKFNLNSFRVLPKVKLSDLSSLWNLKSCVMPPVEQWLDGFNKAKFVVTDSFHGTVFSILFKKPFIAIGNINRGMTRFDSLLKMFNLQKRLIHSENDLTEELLDSEIDFDTVHQILARERKKAEMFLIKALS